mmetsp:Transcript_40283/g.94655  ORF Transcript_40283/g.94655 Transcript_40283/m.94655 type:complete len:229 (+) Transcript_40283:120-806(+)
MAIIDDSEHTDPSRGILKGSEPFVRRLPFIICLRLFQNFYHLLSGPIGPCSIEGTLPRLIVQEYGPGALIQQRPESIGRRVVGRRVVQRRVQVPVLHRDRIRPGLKEGEDHLSCGLISRGAVQGQVSVLVLGIDRLGVGAQEELDHLGLSFVFGSIVEGGVGAPIFAGGSIRESVKQGTDKVNPCLALRSKMEGEVSPLGGGGGSVRVECGEDVDELRGSVDVLGGHM